ncbi:MAG TPA: ABC transporter permease [Verrucomicrobiota bacterium]|nr:ABC transporter permease [Verrucomicrobiota bacterium]HNT14418.1 ABC transporter permease [Verrucomicrobiota bacterium]
MPDLVIGMVMSAILFALLSLGLLISTRAQNQMQALQISMMFILSGVLFSGFIFPRETCRKSSMASARSFR